MVYTAETNQAAAAAAAAGGTGKKEQTDPDIFARELGSKIAGSGATHQERIAQSLERLNSLFPGMTVSTREMAGFSQVTEYYTKVNDDTSINISPQIMADMAEDEELFKRVQDMLSNLFTAGSQQKLVNSGGQSVHRNINIQETEIRYVEVQRTSGGARLSVGSLSMQMQNDQLINDTLDRMLGGARGGNGQSGRSGGSSSGQNFGFQNMVSSSSAWRFEALLSAQSATRVMGSWSAGSTVTANLMDQQMLQTSQTITANLEIMIEQWQVEGGGVDLWSYMQIAGLSDPLVLDLGDEGINLRGPEDGVYFDIKGDGSPVRTAFIQGNNAFLYLDGNGNGVVDDANELFGDHGGYRNGFEKLAQYDDNGDGVIDEKDAIYNQLRVWRDMNGDGVNQLEESMSLAEAGIASLNLRHDDHMAKDAHGNVIGERSSFTRADGSQGMMADVWLRSL